MEQFGYAGAGPEIEHLMRSAKAGRIVHAYLLAGARGCGKRTLANALAQALVCGAEEELRPCGVCPSCKRFLSGNHPDVRVVSPKGRSIGVEEVRTLTHYLSRRPYEGGRHIAMIHSADKLTASAQNALLKTLESPPEDTVFFLLTDAPAALLPTVRSRLRLVRVAPLSGEACARALVEHGVEPQQSGRLAALAHGSVGRALEIWKDDGFEPLLAQVLASLSSLQGAASVAGAVAPLCDARERQEDILQIMETVGRDCMAAQNGATPAALTRAEIAPLRISGRALLLGVANMRRMLSANVAWQNALDATYFSLIKEREETKWRQ